MNLANQSALCGHVPDQDSNPPDLSVVIASVNPVEHLDACLAALTRQRGSIRSEIVVADRVGAEVRELIERAYPQVILLSGPSSTSIPRLRALGIARSTGRIVAITEDHCVPAEDWFERIVAAHQGGYAAVGGAIENGRTARLVDWAVYLCEYHRHTFPTPKGVTDNLPGMNVAYTREALAQVQDLLGAERWEDALHARLRARGLALYSDPSILVSHEKSFRIGGFLAERYHYARAFAGARVERAARLRRLAYGIGALGLPPILLGRMGRQIFRRRRHRATFLRALPLLALFTFSWAAGESVGSLVGSGDSLAKVR